MAYLDQSSILNQIRPPWRDSSLPLLCILIIWLLALGLAKLALLDETLSHGDDLIRVDAEKVCR